MSGNYSFYNPSATGIETVALFQSRAFFHSAAPLSFAHCTTTVPSLPSLPLPPSPSIINISGPGHNCNRRRLGPISPSKFVPGPDRKQDAEGRGAQLT